MQASLRVQGLLEADERFRTAQELLSRRDVLGALRWFNFAEELGYSASECAAGRWMCWMLLGKFEQAWQESDRIRRIGPPDPHRFWTGTGWVRKRVMLRCLHGLGDTVQFIRYAPWLRRDCVSLVVQAHPELFSLLQCVQGIDEVTTWTSPVPQESNWDVQMEITELPFVFRSLVETIPTSSSYIAIPQERKRWASQMLTSTPEGFRVGLVWQAGPFDPRRSIEFTEIEMLLDVKNCVFHSLQKGNGDQVLNPAIHDLAVHAHDVLDTAALMENLDLVITVDTMTAHLAGAIGRPVWILLPANADWRWMLDRNDSPWYSTARLFRQEEDCNWPGVIDVVKAELSRLAASENISCVHVSVI